MKNVHQYDSYMANWMDNITYSSRAMSVGTSTTVFWYLRSVIQNYIMEL